MAATDAARHATVARGDARAWWQRLAQVHRQRWFAPVLALAFLAIVAWLIADHVREIDWGGVRSAVAAYPASTLAGAAALAAVSHLTYATYDLLGRRYAGHAVTTPRVLGVAFVSYAFNLNLGTLVGGVGLRIRLYTRLGLDAAQISRVIALAIVTNWSGWLLLAGAVFAAGQVALPPSFPVSAGAMQAVGVAMLLLPLAYAAGCFFSQRREWQWRTHRFVLPSGRMALAQLALSSLNWALIGAVVWLLLPRELGYGTVLATHLSAAVIAVPTHVPGGLGVLEAVYVAALGSQAPAGALIAGLLTFRALYYLVPLALAAVLHVTLEVIAKRRPRG